MKTETYRGWSLTKRACRRWHVDALPNMEHAALVTIKQRIDAHYGDNPHAD